MVYSNGLNSKGIDLLADGQRWRCGTFTHNGEVLALCIVIHHRCFCTRLLSRITIWTCFKSLLDTFDVFDDAMSRHLLSKLLTMRVLLLLLTVQQHSRRCHRRRR